MKPNKSTLTIAGTLFVLFGLYLIAFHVGENEHVIRYTFGKPDDPITEKGLNWKWPAPIQTIQRFESRICVFDGKTTEILTSDKRNVIVQASIPWQISDSLKFANSVESRSDFEDKLAGRAQSAVLGVFGENTLANLVSTNTNEIRIQQMEIEIEEMIKDDVNDEYGVSIISFNIKRLSFPEGVTTEVFNNMRKEREVHVQETLRSAKENAQGIRQRAEAEKKKMIASARAESKEIMAKGDAEAAQYYKVFEKNKSLAVFLRKLDALEEILKERSTIILDTSIYPFDMFEVKKNERK